MRILVCGGRDYKDYDRVREILCEYGGRVDEEHMLGTLCPTIIHGGAKGADSLADQWAVISWWSVACFPADWDKHGRSAGPIRNQQMIMEGKPDLCLAFPGGVGTKDMVNRCIKYGVPIRRIDW